MPNVDPAIGRVLALHDSGFRDSVMPTLTGWAASEAAATEDRDDPDDLARDTEKYRRRSNESDDEAVVPQRASPTGSTAAVQAAEDANKQVELTYNSTPPVTLIFRQGVLADKR